MVVSMQYLISMVGNTMFKLVASEPWQRVLRLPCVAPGQDLEYLDNGDSNGPTERTTCEASAEALRTSKCGTWLVTILILVGNTRILVGNTIHS